MNKEVIVDRVTEAYRSNPVLTGLLLMNAMLFGGTGWYVLEMQKDNRATVQQLQDEQKRLNQELVNLALKCKIALADTCGISNNTASLDGE